eukprot:1960099-Pleurochrysis_carterae.AAC.3
MKARPVRSVLDWLKWLRCRCRSALGRGDAMRGTAAATAQPGTVLWPPLRPARHPQRTAYK